MSSPLDARIRRLAREELGSPAAASDSTDRVTALEKEVADLRSRLDALEQAAGQEEKPVARRTRKAADTE